MAEVVQPHMAQAGAGEQRRESSGDVARFQRRADSRSENQTLAAEHPAAPKCFRRHGTPMLAQRGHRDCRKRYRAARALSLRREEHQPAADTLQRLTHLQRARVQVDVAPPEPERLPAAKPNGKCNSPQRVQPVPGGVRQERPRLGDGERMDLVTWAGGDDHQAGDVARQHLFPDRLLQRGTQDCVQLLHGRRREPGGPAVGALRRLADRAN